MRDCRAAPSPRRLANRQQALAERGFAGGVELAPLRRDVEHINRLVGLRVDQDQLDAVIGVVWEEVAHFLFIDESGYDSGSSPYGVLGGIAIEDRDVWNLVQTMQAAELRHFGTRYSAGRSELKAKKLISAQIFRQARLAEEIPHPE
ncbi:MAG: DUF3800 domain-containing protein [Acidobacteriota bacterium]